jgi:hypothetical protein
MSNILQTALARLEREQRLVNPRLKGATHAPRRFGYRGDLVLEFRDSGVGEQREPELLCQQVLAVGNEGAPTIAFFAGYLSSFSHLKDVVSVLSGILKGGGKYFLFCGSVGPGSRYQIPLGGAIWYVLPIAGTSVENELLSLLYIDRLDYEELEPQGQLDAIADAAIQYDVTFDMMTYAEGVERFALP